MSFSVENIGKGVWVLTLNNGDNRFNPESMTLLNSLLDEVEQDRKGRVLVTTGTGKFFSNGLDQTYMMECGDPAAVERMLGQFESLLARMLSFPLYTIAAINGHAFAGGAMFSCAHDFRVMRTGRGYFCMNEIDLGMVTSAGMTGVIKTRISDPGVLRDVMLVGKRYSAEQALSARIIDAMYPEEEVLSAAIELGHKLAAKNATHRAVHGMKLALYSDVYTHLVNRAKLSKAAL
mmetsp:Transcript_1684/g.5997  ORF Transcript_1684/g.5997 Transcript_1684/m.5997 type:complete len:234 (+) Transcript_1684:51-752(+)|eukprot:CAMPEP_0114621410 /NCGR_PEP_ID=MMETSP0168-20121206/9215_1 /TAXON_ID=95228 ORGANISM="Vannella sp., Strain DIVA3 517/6/12" /NCGR_SAMPLE_ID=MMETSP0168 /ASSEMBLY_ACC=CAM_ASM_000044 /LENGTH=233 /DNA_ID=CAMNT_0001832609 /DNA_START=51 /DNA_END=752 /DNA_ORIENTATION=-